MEVLKISLVLSLALEIALANDLDGCDTLKSLAHQLYSTKGNEKNLTKVFFPPLQDPAKFLNVRYHFLDENNRSNCSVSYIWAEGGFLLIQPPLVFQFTSLLFNHIANNEYDPHLHLTFPSACRHLVYNNCSCKQNPGNDDDHDLLLLLTHQLKSYARYSGSDFFRQDDSVRTYAICDSDLGPQLYYLKQGRKKEHDVFYFFIATILLPVISLILTATIVRSLHRSIHVRIIRTAQHQNVAGLVLTGIFVTFYIIGCDIFALYYAYSGKSEIDEISEIQQLKKTINYISTIVLLGFDVMVCFIPLTVLLYVCCKHLDEDTHVDGRQDNQQKWYDKCAHGCCLYCNRCVRGCCLNKVLHQAFKLYFNAVFGTLNLDELWKIEDKKEQGFRLVWVITLALVAPLFAISSHISFILVSWLTNKTQASSVALICIAVLSFSFFMFRQCYTALSASERIRKAKYSSLLLFYPIIQTLKQIAIMCCCRCCCCSVGDWIEKGDLSISTKLALRNEALIDDMMDENQENAENQGAQNENQDNAEDQETQEGAGIQQRGARIAMLNREDYQFKEFSTRAFCVAFAWGWVLAGMVGLVIVAFMILPIVAFDLLSDLVNTFQILLILIGLLITYKILNLSEPDIYRFLGKMREAFLTKSRANRNNNNAAEGNDNVVAEDDNVVGDFKKIDDIEATGYLVGELAEVVVHKFR